MRSVLILIIAAFSLFALSCSKGGSGGGGGNPPPGGEPPLQVTMTPANNSTQPASVDVDFPVKLVITSTMPAQGVTVDVTAKKDDGSGAAPFFSTTVNTSATTIDVIITGTPLNVMCLANVTVTSRTSLTNKFTGSFRYSRK